MGGMCIGSSLLLRRATFGPGRAPLARRLPRFLELRQSGPCLACSRRFYGVPIIGGIYTEWAGSGNHEPDPPPPLVASICPSACLPPTIPDGWERCRVVAAAGRPKRRRAGVSWGLGYFLRREPARCG